MNVTPPYECPLEHCDIECEDVPEAHRHFTMYHAVYEQRYAMLQFFDSGTYLKYEDTDEASRFDLNNKKKTSGIKNYPFFTVELFESYFGSISNVHSEIGSDGYLDTDYELPEEIRPKTPEELRRERLLELNSTGHYDKYGRNYEEKRKKAIERDDFECAVCGSDEPTIQIHHIKPASYFHEKSTGDPDYETMNEISNLVTLCASCHGNLEGKWEDSDRDEFVERAREYLGPRTELSRTVSDS